MKMNGSLQEAVMTLRDGTEALDDPEQRWRFVRRNRESVAVLLTEYSCVGRSAKQNLESLRRLDSLAVKIGYSWDMVTLEEARELTVISEANEASHGLSFRPDAPVSEFVSEETYLSRMRSKGIDEDEARKLKTFLESL